MIFFEKKWVKQNNIEQFAFYRQRIMKEDSITYP